MRLLLALIVVALAAASAASAKEGTAVLVVGPRGPTFVEPYRIVVGPLGRLQLTLPPVEPYVLVFPLMRDGVPMRPGRWYPRAGVLCSGWRSGVEAGCTTEPKLRGWLGSGVATGVFRREPARLTRLLRAGAPLLPYGNEATAVKLALAQRSKAAPAPDECVSFRARWTGPGAAARPGSFCVSSGGGVYAGGRLYPLQPTTAAFVIG
jgi:hypothetical protein